MRAGASAQLQAACPWGKVHAPCWEPAFRLARPLLCAATGAPRVWGNCVCGAAGRLPSVACAAAKRGCPLAPCCSCLFPYPPGQESPVNATFNGVANAACCTTCFNNGFKYFNYYTSRPNGPCWCINQDLSYPYLDSNGNYISTRSIFGTSELMLPARCHA